MYTEQSAKMIMLNPLNSEKAALQNLTDETEARNQENIDQAWGNDQAWSNFWA